MFVLLLANVALGGCGNSRPSRDVSATIGPGTSKAAPTVDSSSTTRRVGAQCTPYGKSSPEGPVSYLVTDSNKPGVPKLEPAQRRLVETIHRYVHSKTLRFAFVDNIIVYDATLGPCLYAAGGYAVLSGNCNDFYEPGLDPYAVRALPGCFRKRPPWIAPADWPIRR